MPRYSMILRALYVVPLTIFACTLSLVEAPHLSPPTQTSHSTPAASTVTAPGSPQPGPFPTGIGVNTPPTTETAPVPFCQDKRPRELISRFKAAILASDGAILAELVSPAHGMDARLFRDGRVVNYDREHARALFESTYAVDWGIAPGSGLHTVGTFRELFVPDLLDVLSREYALSCNDISVGGTTYPASWPYEGVDFYSLYFPGSTTFGELDWHTWVLGIQSYHGNPYLYAMMQFRWEP